MKKTIGWERLEISSRKVDILRNISCKDGHNKGQKWYDLTAAKYINKWCKKKKKKEEVAKIHRRIDKKDLHDPDNHDGVITHLQPDILECKVKWALGSITMNKASGGDGIPV